MPSRKRFRSRVIKPLSLGLFVVMLSWNGSQAAEPVRTSVNPGTGQLPASNVQNLDTVVVNGFSFSGNASLSSAELQTLLSGYIGQSCDLDKLREAAGKVSDEYSRRGHPLAKAYIPPQTIAGGIVQVMVVEGRIGRLNIEGNKNYSSAFIRRYLTAGNDAEPMTIDRLEKGLMILNSDFTDLKVTANFTTGAEPGTTDINVKVEDRTPVHVTLTSNNYGSELVSRYRFGAQAEWVNALIPGGYLMAGGTIGNQIDNMKVFSGSYEFPVNSVGTRVGMSVLDGNFDIGKAFKDLGIHNEETSGDLYISHPFVKSRMSGLTGKLGLRAAEAKYYLMNEISKHDHTSVVYLQLNSDHVSLGGKSFGVFTISKGLGGALGGTKVEDPLSSRINASNDFTRFNLDLARYQPVSDMASAMLRVSGQWTGDSLLADEEWLIGGVNSVHGYALGEASGDKGYNASLSFRLNPLKNKEVLQLATFIDHGYAYKKYIQAGSKQTTELTGVGFGVSSHLFTIAPTDFRFDIGFPLNPSSNYADEKPVLYFETSIRL